MATGLSTTNLANAWLNALRGTSFNVSTGTYVRLHTGDPGSAGTSNNAVGSTTRVQASFAAASGGAIALTGTFPQWTNGGTSETITHVSVWTAATSGNFLFSASLSATRAWVSGDTFVLTALGVSLTPLAA